MKNNTTFHPVVEDSSGRIRRQFSALHAKTKVSKKLLAAKIFELGLAQIAANEQLTISLNQ